MKDAVIVVYPGTYYLADLIADIERDLRERDPNEPLRTMTFTWTADDLAKALGGKDGE